MNVSAIPPACEPQRLRPVERSERIVAIDVIRGFALFGILLVNMAFFSTPFTAVLLEDPWWPAPVDRAAEFVIRALAEGKFYVLFSLLFGLGMALQMQRATARRAGFSRYYIRRLLVLMAFGIPHMLLLWYGDILHVYALLGFVLLLFRNRRDATVGVWAVVLYLLPLILMGAITAAVEVGRRMPDAAAIDQEFANAAQRYVAAAEASVTAYQTGSFQQVFAQRLSDIAEIQFGWIIMGPTVAAMFLLGLLVGRRGIMRKPQAHLRLLHWLLWLGLPVGLALNLAYAAGAEISSQAAPSLVSFAAYASHWAGAPPLAFGYAAGLLLLMRIPSWQQRLAPLAAVGRMALTNYLLQTVICTTIFYSYGLGLFGQVGPAWTLLLAILIYATQIPFSVWWLKRFRFGPMEWLWRTLTYGQLQPMRIARTQMM